MFATEDFHSTAHVDSRQAITNYNAGILVHSVLRSKQPPH